jgi:acetolactate synthase-1/2/3 large subunit
MSASKTNFADWLAAKLAAAGLKRAFGVPGGGTSLDLIAALRGAGIDTVITAREDAAVMMAGIAGILDQAPGLAFTTKGPGLANATNGLASAALDRMPAMLVSEAFDDQELNYLTHQVFSQSELVAPLLAAGGGVELAAEPGAIEAWLAGPHNRPATLFPSAEDWRRPVSAADQTTGSTLALPDLTAASALLATARKPVIVVGLAAANPQAAPALRQLATALGAPVLCSYMAKGTIDDADPLYCGIFTGGAIEQATVRAADSIVLAGLDPVELIRKPWPYDAPVLELSEQTYQTHYVTANERVLAPLPDSLAQLSQKVGASDWLPAEIAALRETFNTGMEAGDAEPLSSAALVKAAAAAFDGPHRPRLSVDAGAHMFSACAFWPTREPRDILISNGLASMGFALPAAIAAALHDPERGALAMTGDGGLLMCLGELKTAAEENCNLTVIVFNDGCLSLIDIKRQDRQFPDLGLSWTPPDFAAIARGFGFTAWRVEDADDLTTSLAAAAATKGPRLLDIRIDASGYPEQMRALRG